MSRNRKRKEKPIVVFSHFRLLDDPPAGKGPLKLVGRELGVYLQEMKGAKLVAHQRPQKGRPHGEEEWVGSFVFKSIRRAKGVHGGECFTFEIDMLESLTGLYAKHAEEEEGPLGTNRDNVRVTGLHFAATFADVYGVAELPPYCPSDCLETLADAGILLGLTMMSPAVSALSETQLIRIRELIWWFSLRLSGQRKADALAASARQRINGELDKLKTRLEPLEAREAELRPELDAAAAAHSAEEAKARAAHTEADKLRQDAQGEVTRRQERLQTAEVERDRAPELFRERQTRALQVVAANGADSPAAKGAKSAAEQAHAAISTASAAVDTAREQLNRALGSQRRASSNAAALTVSADRALDAAQSRYRSAREAYEPVEKELGEIKESIAKLGEELTNL